MHRLKQSELMTEHSSSSQNIQLNCQQFAIRYQQINQWQTFNNKSGTQVSISELVQQSQSLNLQQKKRNKKKQYKKRKRQKCKNNLNLAKQQLSDIIEQIYAQQTTFEQQKDKIEICLSYFDNENNFFDFLNQAIRGHIYLVQNSINQYRETLLNEDIFQNQDHKALYLLLVYKLCEEYQYIKAPSREIQKLISFYMFISANKYSAFDSLQNKNLDKNTFNYLINSDERIKEIIKCCDRKISEQSKQRLKINTLIDIMMYQSKQLDQTYNEQSLRTYYTEQQYQQDFIEKKEKKSKKKKKIKQSDLTPCYEDIIIRLNEFNIDQDRQPCFVTEQWIQDLQKNIYFTINNLQKQQRFK